MEKRKEDFVAPASWPDVFDRLARIRGVTSIMSSGSLSPLTISLAAISIIVLLTIIKICQLVELRRKTLAEFKSGNILVAGQPGLFSGHINSTLLRNDNLKQIDLFHKHLGKSYALFFGPDPWLMTVDLALIQRVFVTEGSTHVDITLFRLPFVTEINESLAQVGGDKWRVTRRLMSPSFTPKQMKSDQVFDEIERVCGLFMEFIEEHNKQQQRQLADKNQVEIDVNHGFKQFSMEVIFRVAFGRAHNERLLVDERDELIDWIDEGSELVVGNIVGWGIMFGPLIRRILGFCSQFTPLGTCIRYIHSILADNLEKRRQMKKEKSNGFQDDHRMIDSLMESFESGKMDDEMLQANLFFILLSGFETTANTLVFMFWLLAKHQDKQEKLRGELMRAGEDAEYLDWVISETLRLYPAVPAAIGRILEHDIEHEGMKIKKGVTVVASIWSLHRWHEYWGTDVEQYRPERFDDEEAQKKWPLRMFAFAAGPRYCIGKHLALSEIKTLATRVFMKYRVELPRGADLQSIDAVSPNMIHFIIRKPVKLIFTQISNL